MDKTSDSCVTTISLSEGCVGQTYSVLRIAGGHGVSQRLFALGLVPGAKVKIISNSGHGPVGIEVLGSRLALGRGVSQKVIIGQPNGQPKEIVVALAGNPNCGKSTIFNQLTGTHQHVANYPGVTVEKKEGILVFRGRRIKVIDLPGCYSLTAHAPDELIARRVILEEKPDIVVDIVDATNIERHLYLTTQLAELGAPLVIALNMSDMAEDKGMIIDHERLARLLGIPIVPTVANKKRGITELLETIVACADSEIRPKPVAPSYGAELERELAQIERALTEKVGELSGYSPRWLALKLLEGDEAIHQWLLERPQGTSVAQLVSDAQKRLKTFFGEDPAAVISDRRYGFISGACSEAISSVGAYRHDLSDSIDRLLIHPTFGLIFFAFLMWLVFYATFRLAEKPVQLVEMAVAGLSSLATSLLAPGVLQSLIVDGIIAGVGGVIVFLPNIMILFFAIAVLEDTGYMARAAFVMDRLMHKIGLHGKSFIPMMIGFGCSVPAYMSSRIIEDRTDRLITMHVTTFLSCSARLPVYVLVCGAFWPHNAGNVMFSIYVLGILTAIAMVKLLRKTRFRGTSSPFVIELPPYRVPTLRSLFMHMWQRAILYLRKAGSIILGISIIMWFLMSFPAQPTERLTEQSASSLSMVDTAIVRTPENLAAPPRVYSFEHTLAARMGHLIEPLIKPLGFDWRLGIALVSGFAAKEVVVSTMGTIYGVTKAEAGSPTLRARLASDPKYSRLVAYAFLVFVLLYMPCMSAIAVFWRETGSVRESLFQVGYTTVLAWLGAFVVYQGGRLFGLG